MVCLLESQISWRANERDNISPSSTLARILGLQPGEVGAAPTGDTKLHYLKVVAKKKETVKDILVKGKLSQSTVD